LRAERSGAKQSPGYLFKEGDCHAPTKESGLAMTQYQVSNIKKLFTKLKIQKLKILI